MESVIRHYRALHQIPETALHEEKTSAYIAQALQAAGLSPVRLGKTSLMADLCMAPDLPWLVLRADMDALPIPERTGLPFSSRHAGAMHACGHDGHCAMLLAAAERLAGKKLAQNVRFLFQCAEEVTMGAAEAITLGAIPENTLGAFAFHIWPGLQAGELYTTPGAMMASGDVFRITFRGESIHCALRPPQGDTLRAAVELAHRLPQIEALAQGDGSMVFCGSIHSGTSHNIVPGSAEVYGTIRSFSGESRQKLLKGTEQAMEDIARQMGVSASLAWEGGCPPISNDPGLLGKLPQVLPGLHMQLKASLTGEDFACYQRVCPGVMLWLGNGASKPLHNDGFCIDPAILEKGAESWERIARFDWHKCAGPAACTAFASS